MVYTTEETEKKVHRVDGRRRKGTHVRTQPVHESKREGASTHGQKENSEFFYQSAKHTEKKSLSFHGSHMALIDTKHTHTCVPFRAHMCECVCVSLSSQQILILPASSHTFEANVKIVK